jgi:hypothetical protein
MHVAGTLELRFNLLWFGSLMQGKVRIFVCLRQGTTGGRIMVIVMDMQTGLRLEDEFGPFEDEVLGANWMPQPEAVAAVVGAVAARPNRPEPGFDVEAFLRNVYLSQE